MAKPWARPMARLDTPQSSQPEALMADSAATPS